MCILFIYTNPTPKKGEFRLIIASNRDEYYERPAKPAFFCPKYNIIGGRDLQEGKEGGMWLGASLNETDQYKLRFGVLLNVTGENRRSEVEGRGFIITKFLKNKMSAVDYVEDLQTRVGDYNAFNFVAVEIGNQSSVVFHQSNAPVCCSTYKDKQILGFGNSTAAVPLAKVVNGTDRFTKVLEVYNNVEQKEDLIKELLKLLKSEDKHLPDPELQRRSPLGFPYLCRVFVKVLEQGYGTRAHSIILVDHDWNMDFRELSMEDPINPEIPKWQLFKYLETL